MRRGPACDFSAFPALAATLRRGPAHKPGRTLAKGAKKVPHMTVHGAPPDAEGQADRPVQERIRRTGYSWLRVHARCVGSPNDSTPGPMPW